MPTTSDGYISFRGYRTWYETHGDLRGGVPVVLLHGGPGIPGNSFVPVMLQMADRRPVIRYDQLGCGRSDRPNDPSLWRVATFVDELAALRHALGLDEIHLLGHSWGGTLAIEYVLNKPVGVRSLVLSSTLSSTRFWIEEARRLREAMPAYVVNTMRRFEERHDARAVPVSAVGETQRGIAPHDVRGAARMMRWVLPVIVSAPVQRIASWASFVPAFQKAAYEIAGTAFMRRHVCRLGRLPLMVCQDFLARNQQVYETMWGPSEFFATGLLADWNIEPRLGEIDVPTLIVSGRYDEATPAQQQRLKDGIAGSQWTVLEHSAHLTFIEEPDRYREVVTAFLDAVEAGTMSAPKSLA